jgi:hypothetical protein
LCHFVSESARCLPLFFFTLGCALPMMVRCAGEA